MMLNTYARSLLLALTCLVMALPVQGGNDKADWQVWTSKDGRTITATLVDQGQDRVKLKRKDNLKVIQLKLNQLSQPDVNYLKKRWEVIQKREAGIKKLIEAFPAPISKPVYRVSSNHFAFKPAKKNQKIYRQLEVTRNGFYDRFERNFRFINGNNLTHQLKNIKGEVEKQTKRTKEKSGGVTLIAIGAQVDKEWLDKQLKPYYQKWVQLEKDTQLPTKPKPQPKPQPKAQPKPEETKPKAQPEAKPKEQSQPKPKDGG